MALKDAGEYHPLSFCRVYKIGINPWQLISEALWDKGWDDEAADILRGFNVRDMVFHKRRKLA